MLRPWTIQIELDNDSKKAVYLQIADSIIQIIKNGTLKSGDVLPSGRQLSEQLNVNRMTILKALDILIAEGWINTEERKGIFVAATLPVNQIDKKSSSYCSEKDTDSIFDQAIVSFDPGSPNANIAPIEELASAHRKIFNRKAKNDLMRNINELGSVKFRKAVSKMLNQTRGLHTDYSQIMITRGSQMAIYLTAQCLLSKGDIVVVEDPGYPPAWDIFRLCGAEIVTVSVDNNGLNTDDLRKILIEKKVKAVYITPHHQYPTTETMSLKTRLELIGLSNKYDFTIIEDDFDYDFHFGQRPIAPLYSLNEIRNKVYIGTFSKIVSVTLRVGYLVAHPDFIQKLGALRMMIDLQGDNIMEHAILELIESGVMTKHIRKASRIYKNKRDFFARLIDTYLSGKVTYKVPEGGLAFWLKFNNNQDLIKLQKNLMAKGVDISHSLKYYTENNVQGLRLGYAALSEEQLERGIKALASVIE